MESIILSKKYFAELSKNSNMKNNNSHVDHTSHKTVPHPGKKIKRELTEKGLFIQTEKQMEREHLFRAAETFNYAINFANKART